MNNKCTSSSPRLLSPAQQPEDFKVSPQVGVISWVLAFAVYFVNVIAKDVNWSKSSTVFYPSVKFVNSLDLPKYGGIRHRFT